LDRLCRDAQNNWVVIELKAYWADDDAVGQILGYMSWVRDNLSDGSTVRGIIICKNTTGRVKAAVKLIPTLSIKRYTLDCRIDEMN
jgi:RecB family endonuclease NucS